MTVIVGLGIDSDRLLSGSTSSISISMRSIYLLIYYLYVSIVV